MLQRETLQMIFSNETCKDILRQLYNRYIEKPKVLTLSETNEKKANAILLLQKAGLLHHTNSNNSQTLKLTSLGRKISYYFASWYNVSIEKELIKSLQATFGKEINILDVGCGSGGFLLSIGFNLASQVCTGIDIDMDAILLGDVLQKIDKEKNIPPCLFIRGDVHALPFKDNTFDVVVCNRSLQYFDIKTALLEISRVARNNAFFCFGGLHAPGFYLDRIANKTANFRNDLFPLLNSAMLRFIGKQILLRTRSDCPLCECGLTQSTMRKLLGRHEIIIKECKITRKKWGMPIFLNIEARRHAK